MLRRPSLRGSLLFAVLGAGALSWSTDRTSNAYVELAADVGHETHDGSLTTAAELPASDPNFRVTTEGPRDCRLGFECVVTLTLIPASGWHANREFPWRFLAQPDSGLVFETNATTRGAAVFSRSTGHVELRGETAVVRVVVRPTTVGAHRITGRLRVGICNGEWCRNAEQRVSIELPVS